MCVEGGVGGGLRGGSLCCPHYATEGGAPLRAETGSVNHALIRLLKEGTGASHSK